MKILRGHVLALILCVSCMGISARAATTNFFEGFEGGLTNWVVGDADPADATAFWAIVNASFGGEGTHGGSFKAYCAGFGYSGSASSPDYRDDMTAYLSRTVDLSGHTNATLSFWSRIPSIESGYDHARVLVNNSVVWSTDQPQTSWTLVTLSLESFIGATQTLTFEFDSDGSITEEGWYLDDITLTDAATPAPPPANDDFNAAQIIVGALGSAGGSNRGATSEVGEPHPGNSIWFRWVPFTNGIVTFRTGGSAFDTLLCVYTGSTLASLATMSCDDNGDSNDASLVSFHAVAGTTYYLSVRGQTNAAGFVLLNWEQPNGFGVDLLPDLFVWTNIPNNYLYGWYLDQAEPTQPGRTLLRVSTATPNIGAGALELRGSSTSPGVYQRIYRADGSFYDRFAGNFTFHPGHGHLHFDNWINLHLRAVLTNDGVGGIVASGDKTSFAIIDLTRYNNSLPGSPPNAVYTGGLLQGLSVGWADIYSASLPDQWIDVTGVPSGRYWLEGIVDPANSILESNETNNSARILIDFVAPPPVSNQPPPNDNFTNAITLTGPTAGDLAFNALATSEPGEMGHHSGNSGGHSLWWRWTAPSNMSVVITTDGSSFDTVLAVYTGTNLSNLTVIDTDDDDGIDNNSRVSFTAVSGMTYRIAVDGFSGAVGSVQLNLNPAFNDAFSNCVVIAGMSGNASGSTRGATRQTGEPLHGGFNSSGSIWYCWTAPTNAPFAFDTRSSGFDTVLAIYEGATLNTLAPPAFVSGQGSTRVTFFGFSNTTYRIAVSGLPGQTGVVKLAWSGALPPTIVQQPQSSNALAGSAVTFSVVASGSEPFSYQWRFQGSNLTDNVYVSGSTNASLTLHKILPTNMGVYRVVVTNAFGAVTSSPANLIVLENSRIVFAEETTGQGGAPLRVPIEMQTFGDEHALSFTLIFDPAVLSHPRATNAPPGATLTLHTNQVPSGALGVSLSLPPGQTFATGHVEIIDVVFNTLPVTERFETFAGFSASPIARSITGTNGNALAALFLAGVIELEPLRVARTVFSNGTFRLTFTAVESQRYAIDASEDLITWTPLATNAPPAGPYEFIDGTGWPHRFYRVRWVP